jgi:hypothetical protein
VVVVVAQQAKSKTATVIAAQLIGLETVSVTTAHTNGMEF